MKVYIVTSGDYSEYGIDRIFLDKEKAERYVELSQNRWNSTRLEEWETDDNKQFNEINYIHVTYKKDCKYNPDSIEIDFRKTNDLDDNENNCNENYFWLSFSGEKKLYIERVIKGYYDKEQLTNKYTKVCYDLMAKIDSLLEIECWTEKMIQEWLNQNVDQYLNKN